MIINYEECAKAGVEPKLVANLARRFERLARDADALNIHIFGGGGTSLRYYDAGSRALILAELATCNVDGGDSGCAIADDGYMRGE